MLITYSFDTQWHWQSTFSCKIFCIQKVRNRRHPVLLRSDRCGDGHFYIRLRKNGHGKSWDFISRSLCEPWYSVGWMELALDWFVLPESDLDPKVWKMFFRYDRPTILYGVNLWLTPIPAIAARIFFNENTLNNPLCPITLRSHHHLYISFI